MFREEGQRWSWWRWSRPEDGEVGRYPVIFMAVVSGRSKGVNGRMALKPLRMIRGTFRGHGWYYCSYLWLNSRGSLEMFCMLGCWSTLGAGSSHYHLERYAAHKLFSGGAVSWLQGTHPDCCCSDTRRRAGTRVRRIQGLENATWSSNEYVGDGSSPPPPSPPHPYL